MQKYGTGNSAGAAKTDGVLNPSHTINLQMKRIFLTDLVIIRILMI
jgi:hypothetical protein